jgi:type IX secretion system PorP/SprF family membrane protein
MRYPFTQFSLALLLSATPLIEAVAQQVPMFSGYYYNRFLINPARAGDPSGETRLFGHYRNQYADFEGAPVTTVVTADAFVPEKKFGLGLQIFNDQTNILEQTGFSLAYSYRLDLTDKLSLRLGLAATLSQQGLDRSAIRLEDPSEAGELQGTVENTLFDGDAGLAFDYQGIRFGFSVPQVLQSSTQFTDPQDVTTLGYKNERQYLLNASYKRQISEDFSLEPIVLVRLGANIDPQYEGSLAAGYRDLVYLMAGYRGGYAATAGLGINITESVVAAYNYDMPTNDLADNSSGSHEVMLGVRLGSLFGGQAKQGATQELSQQQETLQERLNEQTMLNIRLREEIAAFKDSTRRTEAEQISIDSLKEQSKAIAQGMSDYKAANTEDAYIVVLGAFRNLRNVIEFRKLRKYLGQEGQTRVKQSQNGEWNLVYQSAFRNLREAQQALIKQRKAQPDLFDKPWIYITPAEK